ncbi:helix-turn-helix transcriptional regulator [Candidatus Palauibacter sp.]|uniref:helix-turn-helix transcriptional regulator n=1 Tax=Candidatus Palauibacter sp. TaxID=3101350 RepID=UPI003B02C331
MSGQDAFDRVVGLLHEATLDDARWPEAARQIQETARVTGHGLLSAKGTSPDDAEVFFMRVQIRGEHREDILNTYLNDYFPRDEHLPRAAFLPEGEIMSCDDLFPDQAKKTSPVYNELLREGEMQDGLIMRLQARTDSGIWCAMGDSLERGGWSSDQIGTVRRLAPHLSQFVQVRQRLADAGALTASLTELLDDNRYGVIYLDRQGRILEVNDHAADLLERGTALRDEGGFLRARILAQDATLRTRLAQALPPFGAPATGGALRIRHAGGGSPVVLHVNPVGDRHPHMRTRQIAALVLIIDPSSGLRIDLSLVAASLGLTPAESQVAVELAQGHSVTEIAERTGRSEGTIRWHVKRIFRKQGITRQAELVRRVLSLHGLPEPPE